MYMYLRLSSLAKSFQFYDRDLEKLAPNKQFFFYLDLNSIYIIYIINIREELNKLFLPSCFVCLSRYLHKASRAGTMCIPGNGTVQGAPYRATMYL